MNVSAILEWVKANVLIVVFVVLMLAAAVVLPIFSGRLNSGVQKEVSARAQNFTKLTQLEKNEFLPGHTGVPNEQTLGRFEQIAKAIADDASNVTRAAVEHNRKGRGVLLGTDLFPEPRASMDVLPKRFHDSLMDAYGNLLREINAGMPPSLEGMREQIQLQRTQFITQDLRKDKSQTLEPDEQNLLRERLQNHRMSICVEAASRSGMYVSTNELGVPVWVQTSQPSLGEMFVQQWQFWVVSDVLRALHEANKQDQTVHKAPVKRVLSLVVSGLPTPTDISASGSSGPGRVGFGGAAMGDSGRAPPSGAPSAPVTINPKAPVPKNFAASITGRTTNSLYDVIQVDLDLIVENARLPLVLDKLAQYNFMTVTSLSLAAVDSFAALEEGYYYGSAPVSAVRLTLETIWLREWTMPFMPQSIKQSLGVGAPPASMEEENPDV